MKKLGLLVMPLMAVSFLASCNGGGSTPTEDVKFSVVESTVTLDDTKKVAQVSLDWTPNDHNLQFSEFTFNLKSESITTKVTAETAGDPRPVAVTITFKDALTKDGKGDLSFHYKDTSAGKEGDGKVEGINIKLSEPVDPTVSEEEFNNAINFIDNDTGKDIEYLQVIGVGAAGEQIDEMSPTVYHGAYPKPFIDLEQVVTKNDDGTYDRYVRYISTYGDYELHEGVQEDYFLTPQSDAIRVSTYLEIDELTFNDFSYDSSTGEYSCIQTYVESDYKTVLKFDNKKVVKFEEREIGGEKIYDFTYTYKEKTPEIPSYTVDANEFNAALTFYKDTANPIQYVQLNYYVTIGGESIGSMQVELSPEVSHDITDSPTEPYYMDKYVKKVTNDTNYYKATRTSASDDFTFESGDADDFLTPQDDDFSLTQFLTGLTYEDFTFNESNNSYEYSSDISFALKFENKKIKSFVMDIPDSNDAEQVHTRIYTYNEITPDFPEDLSTYKVTKEEFNDAMAFKDEEYLQIDSTAIQVLITPPVNEETVTYTSIMDDSTKCAPGITHSLQMTTNTSSFTPESYTNGVEGYFKNPSEEQYEGVTRFYSDDEWTDWEAASPQIAQEGFITPQMYGEVIKANVGNISYDDLTFDEATCSYTGEVDIPQSMSTNDGDKAEVTLKFKNKKLINLSDHYAISSGQTSQEMSISLAFAYEEITPIWPIQNF